jgi:hypothetical protein
MSKTLFPPSLFVLLIAAAAAGATDALPADVRAFQKTRESCEHFMGEEPYDAERKQFIDAALARFCTGTDARLAALKRKYARNKPVMRVLTGYAAKIE